VFDSVADRLTCMNDLMSQRVHRLWKRFAVEQGGLRSGNGRSTSPRHRRPGAYLCGAGGASSHVVDRHQWPRSSGRERLLDAGIGGNVSYVLASAERLPCRCDLRLHQHRLRAA
jgi:demethylmenaquinone methyltransferase/2-methoxy-6-polyprenyl-1,4-benzoquinol methylase